MFSLFFPLSKTQNLGQYIKTNIRRLKVQKRRQMAKGPQDSRNDTMISVSSLNFLFASHIPDGELETQKTQKQWVQTEKGPKSLLSLGKGPGKGQASK